MKKTFLGIIIILPASSCYGPSGNDNSHLRPADSTSLTQKGMILFSFEDSNGVGFKDGSGRVMIAAKYLHSFTDTFSHEIAFVVDPTEGPIAIDRNGKKRLNPFIYDNGPDYIVEGLFRFVEKKKIGFADADGKIIIPANYEFVTEFKKGRACFGNGFTIKREGELDLMKGGKWGFINTKGDTVIQQKYDEMVYFDEGTCVVKEKGKKITIDKDGKEIK